MRLLSLLLSTTSSAKRSITTSGRTFQYIPYGATYDETEEPGIACDGRVQGRGIAMELTHWNGNETPDDYYADTSTGMALRLPASVHPKAVLVNNHYDTDGVLSVFAGMRPELADEYRSLLVDGAAAGDFGEWHSTGGLRLEATLSSWLDEASTEEEAYERALSELPALLHDLKHNEGKDYQQLWESVVQQAEDDYEAVQRKELTIELIRSPVGGPSLALVHEAKQRYDLAASANQLLSCYALHRVLMERGWASHVDRVLRVRNASDEHHHYYWYEKPGHGWVNKLVERTPVSPVVSVEELVEKMSWTEGGPAGMTAICHGPDTRPPAEVAATLMQMEKDQLLPTV